MVEAWAMAAWVVVAGWVVPRVPCLAGMVVGWGMQRVVVMQVPFQVAMVAVPLAWVAVEMVVAVAAVAGWAVVVVKVVVGWVAGWVAAGSSTGQMVPRR